MSRSARAPVGADGGYGHAGQLVQERGRYRPQGEPLFVIETDKATLDVEAPASGVLRRVTAAPGDDVKALSAIAVIAAPGEALKVEAAGRSIWPAQPQP